VPGPRSNWIRHVFIGHFSPRRASLVTSVTGEEFGLTLSDPFSIFQAPQIRSGHDRTFSQLEVGMKNRLLTFALLLFLAPFTSQSQIPRTISYQGVLQKDGSPFSGDALFTFTLYRGTSAAWISPPVPARVTNGVFNTTLEIRLKSHDLFGMDIASYRANTIILDFLRRTHAWQTLTTRFTLCL